MAIPTFLEQIAAHYQTNYGEELHHFGFVFPNRRAGLFFRKELARQARKPIFAPDILGINDLFYSYSPYKTTDQISLLFRLYKQYIRIVEPEESFDHFISFGTMLLRDFNEIDKYLVDARQLFQNLNDLSALDLGKDYLTENQHKALEEFWGIVNNNGEGEFKTDFISVWSKTYELYDAFKSHLAEECLAYDGMAFRHVAELLKNGSVDTTYERLVFIGFNALNPTEKALLNHFKTQGKADFYFDYQSPLITSQTESAGAFVKVNQMTYPSEFELKEVPNSQVPKIDIYDITSGIGQTKIVNQLLRETIQDDETHLVDTAVILPDEKLLSPLLHVIPENIKSVNITMGYPLTLTPVATLIDYLLDLRSNMRMLNGEWTFYYKQVLAILNHPYILQTDEKGINKLNRQLIADNMFNIPSSLLCKETNALLQTIFTDKSIEADAYLTNILNLIRTTIWASESALDKEYFAVCSMAVERLKTNMQKFEVSLEFKTFFSMTKQIIGLVNVPFKGEPLMGLQIMGMLETRALDFKHLIITSFNDNIMPRRQQVQSLIPYRLRKGFGMPTYENNDAIYAYNFYRLLQRAETVSLIYDSRTDNRDGEISRFYYQLKYVFNMPMNENKIDFKLETPPNQPINIKKSERIMSELNRFKAGGDKDISASMINNFIKCPLKSYLEKVVGLYTNDEISEDIEADKFGTIFHAVMEELYKPFINQKVSAEQIDNMLGQSVHLDNIILKVFNKKFLNNQSEHLRRPQGMQLLVISIIKKNVVQTLRLDKKRVPFTYIASEFPVKRILDLGDGLKINIKGYIDRIDRDDNGVYHIVDYKTGKFNNEFKTEEDLFIDKYNGFPSGITQILLYSLVYSQMQNEHITIQPHLYFIQNMHQENYSGEIFRNGVALNNFESVKVPYEKGLAECLSAFFNHNIPFSQTAHVDNNCKYCDFKTICNR